MLTLKFVLCYRRASYMTFSVASNATCSSAVISPGDRVRHSGERGKYNCEEKQRRCQSYHLCCHRLIFPIQTPIPAYLSASMIRFSVGIHPRLLLQMYPI